MSCILCNLEELTTWHYEDDYWIICDCIDCMIPMVVYKKHGMLVDSQKLIYILQVCQRLFGRFELRANQRMIKDHLHFHVIRTKNVSKDIK